LICTSVFSHDVLTRAGHLDVFTWLRLSLNLPEPALIFGPQQDLAPGLDLQQQPSRPAAEQQEPWQQQDDWLEVEAKQRSLMSPFGQRHTTSGLDATSTDADVAQASTVTTACVSRRMTHLPHSRLASRCCQLKSAAHILPAYGYTRIAIRKKIAQSACPITT
jgi:hypothetical protein